MVGLGISEPSPVASNPLEPVTFTSSGCWESIEVKEWPSLFTHSPVKHLMSHMWWGGNTQVSTSTKTEGLEHQKLIHIDIPFAATWLPENTLYYFDRTSNYTLVWWNQDHWNINKCMPFYQQLFASVNGLLTWFFVLNEYPFLGEICLDESLTNHWQIPSCKKWLVLK